MKKIHIITAITVLLTMLSGCSAITIKENTAEESVSAEKFDDKQSENNDAKDDNEDEISDINKLNQENKDNNKSDSDKSYDEKNTLNESSCIQSETKVIDYNSVGESSEQSDKGYEIMAESDDYDAEEIMNIAEAQYEKSCKTQWNFFITCPYELDFNDRYEQAVRVIGVSSIDEIFADYKEIFVDTPYEIAERYVETPDGLYYYDGGRGSNIYYSSTELEFVSYEGDVAVFNAVSHYSDPQTGEPEEDKIHTFSMLYRDGVWKTLEFKLPY